MAPKFVSEHPSCAFVFNLVLTVVGKKLLYVPQGYSGISSNRYSPSLYYEVIVIVHTRYVVRVFIFKIIPLYDTKIHYAKTK